MSKLAGRRPSWTSVAIGIALSLLCVAPVIAALAPIAWNYSDSLRHGLDIVQSARLWTLWLKTVGMATGTVVLSLIIGVPLGFWLPRLTSASNRWLATLLALPLFLPPHVLAVAWIDVLGQQGLVAATGVTFPLYTPVGVIVVQALAWYPIPMIAVHLGLNHSNREVREVARTLAPGGQVLRRVTLPLLFPALGAAALAIFALSMLNLSIPSLLQVPVFMVEIFASFNSLLDQHQALLLALPLLLTGGICAAVIFWLVGRPRVGPAPRHRGSGGANTVFQHTALCLVACIFSGLPAIALMRRVGTPEALLSAWNTGTGEIFTSILLGAAGATLLVALIIPLALSPAGRGSWPFWLVAIAFLVSGPVFGTGLIWLWNHPGPLGFVYDRFPILIIAIAGRYAVFAWLGCQLAVRGLSPELEWAGRNLGGSSTFVKTRVLLPAIRRSLLAVWVLLFLLIMGEVECIVLVAPPGWVPVSLRIFTLMHYGPAELTSALALLQALTSLALLRAFIAIGRFR